MKSKLKIASRNSKLALIQTKLVADKLKESFEIEIIPVVSKADKFSEKPLNKIGGKGMFVRELEKLLINGDADLAIHSLKDMENTLAEKTFICAVMKRESKADVLVSNFSDLGKLPKRAKIGTSSPRRTAFLKAYRDDLVVKMCRGNIETRLKKLEDGEFDALILADAGLKRLKINRKNIFILSQKIMPPPAGQGVIALQCAEFLEKKIQDTIKCLINDKDTFLEILAERSLVKHLNGSCHSPISASANIINDEEILLFASVASLNGEKIISHEMTGKKKNAKIIGKNLAKKLLSMGAKEILL